MMTDQEKNDIIKLAISTDDGRLALAQAMMGVIEKKPLEKVSRFELMDLE